MGCFVEGADRSQLTLLPECLEDWVGEDNAVHVIDVFVEALDLHGMGFERAIAKETGRPCYHPAVLLKLYIYGYLNRVQSSRRLERGSCRNVEVMWLIGRLAPDHKTIADFRKDNGAAIRKVCAKFVALCRQMGLLQTPSVAIDGSKFKAVNNRDRNFTHAKMARRMAQIEESVGRYLRQLDSADRQEPSEAISIKTTRIKEKIARLKQEMSRLEALDAQMRNTPDQQISLTDPDARSMATSGRESGVVGYNVQVAVDTEHHLIVTHEGHQRRQRPWTACSDVEAGQRDARRGQARCSRRPWLLRRTGDTGLRRGWRVSHLAQADDVGREGGGPVRQTGLRLSA
ncbi:transposase [Bradyrhizobium sp. AZCC 1588]